MIARYRNSKRAKRRALLFVRNLRYGAPHRVEGPVCHVPEESATACANGSVRSANRAFDCDSTVKHIDTFDERSQCHPLHTTGSRHDERRAIKCPCQALPLIQKNVAQSTRIPHIVPVSRHQLRENYLVHPQSSDSMFPPEAQCRRTSTVWFHSVSSGTRGYWVCAS
jgi:hypothetical protein